jgi:hypothetical protein
MTIEAEQLIEEMLRTHAELNEQKSVSYLPIKTSQNVLNMTVGSLANRRKSATV